jgi:unspecific monooxygenase
MITLHQSPLDPAFVQNPYSFYETARAQGPFFRWADYDLICTPSAAACNAIFRDRRFGRQALPELAAPTPPHLAPFYEFERHSMLELEPPSHTRLRGLVLRAFTSRRIAALEPEITALTHALVDALPNAGPFDLLPHFAQKLPVIIIARLLGVPEAMAPDLLAWSNAMVSMYMAARTRAVEDRAVAATIAFSQFMRDYIEARRGEARRGAARDDLITHLIAAEEAGEKLTNDELITTCILLLNAGHEATVHTLGNGVKAILDHGAQAALATPEALTEEIMRYDPPLHMFTRWVYEDVDVMGHGFQRGDQVGLLLAAANRDPAMYDAPHLFRPARPAVPHVSLGAGLHFCVGAPLARLELQIALPILFARMPRLRLAKPTQYGNVYHFHGLTALMVQAD